MRKHVEPAASRRSWSPAEIRRFLRLDDATLRGLARDWSAMSARKRRQFYSDVAAETCRRQIPEPKSFTDGVFHLIEERARRDAGTYTLDVIGARASGPDPLTVLVLALMGALGGAAVWVGARHADRVLAAGMGG